MSESRKRSWFDQYDLSVLLGVGLITGGVAMLSIAAAMILLGLVLIIGGIWGAQQKGWFGHE